MVKIDLAKINNDGSITIKAHYVDNTTSQNQNQVISESRGIYKYFITKTPISTSPDTIDHSDVSLVVYYKQTLPINELDVTIDSSEIIADTLNDVLFVYVVTNDNDLQLCNCKDKYDMTSVIPMCKIYSIFMNFIGDLNHDECNIPMNFIDQIMRYIYLMSAQSSDNHYRVKEIWDMYFKNFNPNSNSSSNCGCHG